MLDQVFPEYEKLFSNTFCVSSKELFLHFPTLENMMAVSTQTLALLLHKASKGYLGIAKAEQIQQAASTSIGIT